MGTFISHFRFSQPGWLLLLIPALALLLLRRGRGASASIVFPNLSVLVSLGSRVRQSAWHIGPPLAFAALALAILAMARPVWRDQYQNRSASGIDIVIAFDVSLSMVIDDFVLNRRPITRLEAAKRVVDDFISRRIDDRIGLVAFAGQPVSVCPITLEHAWLRQCVDGLRLNHHTQVGTVEEQGTAIGSALASSALRLDVRQSKSKIIVLITDGASNSGKISPVDAATQAARLGIKIYTVAIGTEEGRVPGSIQAFPRQEFDLPTLREIARISGGEHFWAQRLSDLESTFQTIDDLEKTEVKSYAVVDDRELFPWFLAFAMLSSLAAAMVLALNPPPSP